MMGRSQTGVFETERNQGNRPVSKRVINYDTLKWAVFSFQLYKSSGMDGIMPKMLQQGFELLGG
jgi:hypothetical protein